MRCSVCGKRIYFFNSEIGMNFKPVCHSCDGIEELIR